MIDKALEDILDQAKGIAISDSGEWPRELWNIINALRVKITSIQ